MDYACSIEIIRHPDGTTTLTWPDTLGAAPVRVFFGKDAGSTDFSKPAAIGNDECRITDAPLTSGFFLRFANGHQVHAATRHYALDGATNLRDTGGYATLDGRRARWGRIFRSGHLSSLSAQARSDFGELGIRTVCDFRLATERAGEQADIPGFPRIETLGVPPGKADQHFFHRLFEETDDPARVTREIEAVLRLYVREFSAQYRLMFDALLSAEEAPVLLNCSAGKERTGVGVVLLLLALGVPAATARHDFLLSGRYFPATRELPRVLRKYAVPSRDDAALTPLVMPLLQTPPSYADAVFDAIEEAIAEYGGESRFFALRYGLDASRLAALRDKFTSPD
jgi:protein-tyrosine phosphatase